jgi:chitin synthase
MYRIKARKQDDGDWFPVLVQPTIVSEYSQSVVTTLHQKNLLLLGEDRFLTTLLLRNFPNRKMMFCPHARCRTVVPDTFSILLSQRRRWINSTIHNLMELVLVRNLCGTFCFSMQFITFIDLVGTVVLPIAICLTYSLIINYILTPPTGFSDAIPLILLAGVLGLPAVLIVLTTFKIVYVGWLLVYLIALPIWNFVLPVYAFSKFDDFSWGETRKVEGEAKGGDDHGGAGGVSGASAVPLRRWEDWERSRLRKLKREEKRKREFERQFGSRAVHGTTSNGGSTYAESETASSYGGDEDRWGLQIGAYNEDATTVVNAPPPIGLYAVDEWDEEDENETINQHDLVNVLDQGWDENSPIPSPTPSYSRHMPTSGYSTPSEQQYSYGLTAQPYPPPQHQQQAPRSYSLSDTPMTRTGSSHSASGIPLTTSSASLTSSGEAVDPFADSRDPLTASASSSGVDQGWGGHARQRSLTSSPEASRTGGGGSYGPLGGSNTPSPTRERAGYDFGDAGRRLV